MEKAEIISVILYSLVVLKRDSTTSSGGDFD
jgi:hypothetical protein